MMDLRLDRLQQCHPLVRKKFEQLHADALATLKMRLLIVRGWSSVSDQMKIYQQGREYNRESGEWVVVDKALIKTKAKPGMSGHNLVMIKDGSPASMCVDVIPVDARNQPLWTLTGETPIQLETRWIQTYDTQELTMWSRLYELSWTCGLDPYGDKRGAYLVWDKGHFEEPGYVHIMEDLGVMYPSALIQENI